MAPITVPSAASRKASVVRVVSKNIFFRSAFIRKSGIRIGTK